MIDSFVHDNIFPPFAPDSCEDCRVVMIVATD